MNKQLTTYILFGLQGWKLKELAARMARLGYDEVKIGMKHEQLFDRRNSGYGVFEPSDPEGRD